MTVSRVANESGSVSTKTRERVHAAMFKLGYTPNQVARSMRNQRSKSVGFMLPDLTNVTNATVAQEIEIRISSAGYQMMLVSTLSELRNEPRAIRLFSENRVGAAILQLADETAPEIIRAIGSAPMPCIILDRDTNLPVDTVLSDHHDVVHKACHHFHVLGHRRLAAIIPKPSIRAGRIRGEAFAEFIRGADLGEPVIRHATGLDLIAEGDRLASELLSRPTRPTALLVGSNQLTVGAMRAIRRLNLRIPENLSLIGSDDPTTMTLLSPPLTIMTRDLTEFGKAAAEITLDRLGGRLAAPTTVKLPTRLLLGESCGAPPSG